MFKKTKLDYAIMEHTEDIISLKSKLNTLKERLNETIEDRNKLVEALKLLDKKLALLTGYFQLEYRGGVFISRRKK